MLRYLSHRLLRATGSVLGVVTLVFLLVRIVPGDPVDAILGDQASAEDRAVLRTALRLDRPLLAQYQAFLGDVVDGSLGRSFRAQDRSVASLIAEELPHTMSLAASAMLLALCMALPLGTLAAAKRGSGWDQGARLASMLGLAIPNIWLGPLLVLLFGVQLRWLPLPGDDPTELRALILPTFTIGTALAAILTRQTRSALIDVLGEPYIAAARARGLSETQVLFKHGLRNALGPVLTIATAQLGAVLSGAVVTEKIFERPGLGLLFLDAFFERDIPVIQGCVLTVGVIYVLVNLASDLAYAAIDPRVRLA
jgi:peptide/nickel transport system permease protein